MKGHNILFVLSLTLAPYFASGNCDQAIGDGLCPDAFTLEETAECLVAKRSEVDEGCKAFIEMNTKCGAELARCGTGVAWGSDATLCVTQWTRESDLSPECALTVPKPASTEEEEVEIDEESAKRRAKRKAARARAAEEVRNLNEKKSKKPSKKRSTKRSRRKAKEIEDDDL